MSRFLVWDGLKEFEIESDEPLAPLSILAVDEKLNLEQFRAEGIDDELKEPEKHKRELIAALRYLGNSAWPRLQAGKSWGEWTKTDVTKYFAKIVDTLRQEVGYEIEPPPADDAKWKTGYWQCYKAARRYMKSASKKGGPGSGHFGHSGRPGKIGGSGPGEGGASFRPGKEREKRRAEGKYDVITETSEEYAKILLTQGIEPSFKPEIAELSEFAPGKGLEREGLYVANDEAFSKGSFGQVRLYMTADKGSLKAPQEMAQLGRTDLDDVLRTENGAVTKGRLSKDSFLAVEVYSGGKWQRMSPSEYLESIGVTKSIPKLPTVNDYGKWLKENAKRLYLRDNDVAELLHDYNRGSLEDKIWMAEEAELI